MIAAVNANARTVDGRQQFPSMHGEQGWYGWQAQPWNVGALEVWYWSMRTDDLARVEGKIEVRQRAESAELQRDVLHLKERH